MVYVSILLLRSSNAKDLLPQHGLRLLALPQSNLPELLGERSVHCPVRLVGPQYPWDDTSYDETQITERIACIIRRSGNTVELIGTLFLFLKTREISPVEARSFGLSAKIHMPHFPRLEESAPRAGFFEPDEFNAVLQHRPECLKAPMTFAYLTGWRCRSEVLPLQWGNVDFEAGTVRLDRGSTKNKDGRIIYMTAQLRALLEEQRLKTLAFQCKTEQIISLVFHDNGQPIVNYDKRWKQACQDAGLSSKIPHDLRRTAVRNMVRAGILERGAMQISGHKTRSVFDRYHIVSDRDLQEAAQRLETVFPVLHGDHLPNPEQGTFVSPQFSSRGGVAQ